MEVCSYTPADREALYTLFARAGKGSPTGSLWGDSASEAEIYLTPYLHEDSGDVLLAWMHGTPIGYLAGCLDTESFPREDTLIASAISRHRLLSKAPALAFFTRSAIDAARDRLSRRPMAGEILDSRWPAHLHINVAPEARGSGAGAALIEAWLDRLRERRIPGCHLQTIVENESAMRFFERSGFRRHGEIPLVPGLRWQGQRVHQQTMVLEL